MKSTTDQGTYSNGSLIRRRIVATMTAKAEKEGCFCEVCGRKISKEEYEAYDGLCWECWDDRTTEEIDTTEGTDEEFVPM